MTEQTPLHAAIYARVSSDPQRDNYSIAVQLDKCLEYIREHNYRLVGDWFVDRETGQDVPSSTPGAVAAFVDDESSVFIDRPALNALIDFAMRERLDRVVIIRLDRLARNLEVKYLLERQFRELDVEFEFVEGNNDKTLEGELYKNLEALLAQYENSLRRRRVIQGKRQKAKSGKFVSGRPPYGYYLSNEARSGLEVNNQEAEVVQLIFQLYVKERHSIRDIVRILNARQIPTRRGTDWSRSTVSNILRSETYVGTNYYNKTETRRGLTGEKRTKRDGSEWIAIPVPAIISHSDFEAAKGLLATNRKRRRVTPKRGRFYLLRSLIVCRHCRKPYVAQARKAGKRSRKPHLVYRHRKSEGHCTNHQLSASSIESFVWKQVREAIMNPEVLMRGYEKALKEQEGRLVDARKRLAIIQERRTMSEQKKQNLIDLFLENRIDRDEFDAVRARLSEEINRLDVVIEELEEEIGQQPVAPDLASFRAFTEEIRTFIIESGEPPVTQKRRIFETLDVTVWIEPESGAVEVRGCCICNDSDDGSGVSGLSSTPSAHYALQPPPPPSHA